MHDWSRLFGPRSSFDAFPTVQWESPAAEIAECMRPVTSSWTQKPVMQVYPNRRKMNSHQVLVVFLLRSGNEGFICNPRHSALQTRCPGGKYPGRVNF